MRRADVMFRHSDGESIAYVRAEKLRGRPC
jgi:hypothetical protein